MLSQLKASAALFFLPTTANVLKSFDKGVKALDARTVHIEATLENKAVALANVAHKRRSVHDIIKGAYDHLLASIHAAFDRKEQALIAEFSALRTHLEAASAARDAVAKVIAGL